MSDYEQEHGRQEDEVHGGGKPNSLKYLLLGIGIGAAAAILFTPMSGADCREAIRRGYRSTVDGISETTRSLRERGSNLLGFKKKAAGS